jgi:geranylgeranylglycerol-phosphate geranylgeranyltransferase
MSEYQRKVSLPVRVAQITRPHVALQAVAYTLLGAYLGQDASNEQLQTLGRASIAVALIVSYGFVVNDYYDFDLDKATKPARPLPAKVFTPTEALYIAGLLAGATLIVGITLPPLLFSIVGINLALTTLYSLWLKRTVLLGNIAIAALNSSIVLFGAMAGSNLSTLVWIVAIGSLLYTLGQEVLYTVCDAEGDAAAGLFTTAIYFGSGPSLLLVQACMVLSLVVALVPWFFAAAPLWYPLALICCTIVPLVCFVLPLIWYPTARTLAVASERVKIIRMSSLLPFLLLRTLQAYPG